MIVWLASFPRSGNTYTRLLLNKGLGLKTFSIHEGDNSNQSEVAEVVGHAHSESEEALLEKARKSDEIHVIKTHHAPQSDEPAIYIVRDGRAATISYLHFNHSLGFNASMEQVIEGLPPIGSWSSHLASWNPLERPNTLLLRYEDIVANPTGAIEQIADFLKVPVIGSCDVTFSELHKMAPDIFRKGGNSDNISEMAEYEDMFFAYHGAGMVAMNYATVVESFEASSRYFANLDTGTGSLRKLRDVEEILLVTEKNAQQRYENLFYELRAVLKSVETRIDDLEESIGRQGSSGKWLKGSKKS